METREVATPNDAATQRTIPAWAISVVLHLVLLIVLTLIIRTPTPRGLSAEGDRPVGLVIAEQSSSNQTNYLDESDAQQDSATDAQATTDVAPPLPSQPPAEPASLALPDLDLPGPGVLKGIGDELVQKPGLDNTGSRTRFPTAGAEGILADEAELARRRRAGGKPTQMSVFGSAAAVGRSFVFLIDRSESMGGDGLGALGAAEVELKRALDKLQPTHKFQIIAYHHRLTYFNERRLVNATPDNLAQVEAYLGGIGAYGATQHEMAILAALRLEPDVIFLLTDGGDPYLNAGQIRRIRLRSGGKTTVHSIQFGFTPEPDAGGFMKQLAAENGGNFTYVNMSRWRN